MDNKKVLDQIIQRASRGEFGLDPFVPRSEDLEKDLIKARNLQEDALGKVMLEQYKGKVPNKPDLDFLHGLKEQFLPDVNSTIGVDPNLPNYGSYNPTLDLIKLNTNPKYSPETLTASMTHEGLHSRDFSNDDYGLDTDPLKSGKSQNKALQGLAPELVDASGNVIDPKKMKKTVQTTDIDDLKELLLMGHHGLKRGGTIGRVNLERLLKGLPLLGAAGAALMNPEDASAAVPGLSEAESVGESPEEEKQMLSEIQARKNYDRSPAHLSRLKALMQKNGKAK